MDSKSDLKEPSKESKGYSKGYSKGLYKGPGLEVDSPPDLKKRGTQSKG